MESYTKLTPLEIPSYVTGNSNSASLKYSLDITARSSKVLYKPGGWSWDFLITEKITGKRMKFQTQHTNGNGNDVNLAEDYKVCV